MNEWAARLLAVLPERLNSLNSSITGKPTSDTFDQFMQQVSDEQADRMYIQRDLDETVECRPTFEQVALEPIADEMGRNATILKTLEGVLYERQTGFSLLNTSLVKARSVLETIEYRECSLKTAVDAYFAVADQECQQSKQQIFLGDLKRSLNEIRHDAQRKIADYTKELQYIERDVNAAEKKLTKSKDQFERCIDHKTRIEALEMEGLLSTTRSTAPSSDAASPSPSWVNPSPASNAGAGRHSINSLLSSARKGTEATKDFKEKLRELEETASKLEKEIKEDIRTLLHAIEQRDKTLLAIRKAYQKLDLDCKSAVQITLRKLVEKDLENARLYLSTIENLHSAVQAIDIDSDVQQFIAKFSSEENSLIMTSQALSLLNDLTPVEDTHPPVISSSMASSGTPASNPTPSSTAVPTGGRSAGTSQSPETVASGTSSPALPEPAPQAKRSTYNVGSVWDSDGGLSNKAPLKAEFVSHLSQIFYSATSTEFKHLPPVIEAAEAKSDPPAASPIHPSATIKPIVPVDVSVPVSRQQGSASARASGVRPQQGSNNPFDVGTTSKNPFDDMDSICISRNSSGSQNPFDEEEDYSYLSDTATTSRYKQSLTTTTTTTVKKSSAAARGKSSNNVYGLSKQPHSIQYSDYKHHASPLVFDEPPEERQRAPSTEGTSPVENSQDARKLKAQRDIEASTEQYISECEWFRSHPDAKSIESVRWINTAVKTKSGRDLFTHELNQFRSKQVDVGEGFEALGAVLWNALSYCQSEKDIHNASVIMMLSQTFFRPKKDVNSKEDSSDGTSAANDEVDKDEGEDEGAQRGAQHREYIKEKLVSHVIWQDGNYWEQALWKCTIEQLQTIPYEKDWHDMDRITRFHAVRRVHDVIFSQVMAIIHSMMELGCPQKQTREFLYRMCVIHQLSESQRLQLLEHTLREKSYT